MPNWVQNNVTISGRSEDIKKLLEQCKTDRSDFDFNGLIPRPEVLDLVSGSCSVEFATYYLRSLPYEEMTEILKTLSETPCFYGSYLKKLFEPSLEINGKLVDHLESCLKDYDEFENVRDKTIFEVGKRYVDNVLEYGTDDWYDWDCEHWGTKWNACEASVSYHGTEEAHIDFQTAWSAPIPIYEAILEQYPDLDVYVEYADEDLGNNCGAWFNGDFEDPADAFEFACDIWGYDPEEIKREWYGEDENE